jgi:hypothetical protein
MSFFLCEFRHRSQLLRTAVVCDECVQHPVWHDPSEREQANGYKTTRRPYTANDRACADCGRKPEQAGAAA